MFKWEAMKFRAMLPFELDLECREWSVLATVRAGIGRYVGVLQCSTLRLVWRLKAREHIVRRNIKPDGRRGGCGGGGGCSVSDVAYKGLTGC
jgi:hypothetical protein